ncbi:MAG: succinate dehydrogenase iron-sulfur subunit [Phycisphaerae bacterium]|nr:succinate dehydrogenase iron-sulfur subunit [Phycisphaerae bacterium]
MAEGRTIRLRIARQDGPESPRYWQYFEIPYQPQMNVISALQAVAAHPVTIDGRETTPVVWDCNCLEEVCGACTMLVNGRVRQACTALVDRLLEEQPSEIVLEPMTKFPVVRDLFVDRARMFHSLKRVRAWIAVAGYHDAGEGPRVSPEEQEQAYPLSRCMTCGCCVEACPQFSKIEMSRDAGESPEQYEARKVAAYDEEFLGAAAISQAVLFNTHPTGRLAARERLEAMMGPGGITDCGNAQNCVKVCPKEIPLTRSIAVAGRQTTLYALKRWLLR